jgi:hypothetical protein
MKVVVHRGTPAVQDLGAEDLVDLAVSAAGDSHCGDQIDRLCHKVAELTAIVGRLVALLPEDVWLDVVRSWAFEPEKRP